MKQNEYRVINNLIQEESAGGFPIFQHGFRLILRDKATIPWLLSDHEKRTP